MRQAADLSGLNNQSLSVSMLNFCMSILKNVTETKKKNVGNKVLRSTFLWFVQLSLFVRKAILSSGAIPSGVCVRGSPFYPVLAVSNQILLFFSCATWAACLNSFHSASLASFSLWNLPKLFSFLTVAFKWRISRMFLSWFYIYFYKLCSFCHPPMFICSFLLHTLFQWS